MEASGKVSRTQNLDVPGGPATIDVRVGPLEDVPPVAVEPTHGAASGGLNGVRTLGFVIGGVGLAGIVVGGIFGGLAFAQNGTADANCPFNNGTGCNSTGVSAGSDASTSATISTVAFIAGAVCLGTGVVLVLVGKSSPRTARVDVLPGIGGLLVRGRF